MNSITVSIKDGELDIQMNKEDDLFVHLLYLLVIGKLNAKIVEACADEQYNELMALLQKRPVVRPGEFNEKRNPLGTLEG